VKPQCEIPEDADLLEAIVGSYAYMTGLIRDKQTTIGRLRSALFGSTSEKKEKVFPPEPPRRPGERAGEILSRSAPAKGHGRNGAQAYAGAERIPVPHESLRSGGPCPHCKGRVYARKEPRQLVRIVGVAPFAATVYEQEQLRCGLCGDVFTAKAPAGVGEEKYDATAVSMVAVLRYGSGLPLNRIAGLQESVGVPMPASTQWDLVSQAAPRMAPVHEELQRFAAQGELLHNDDTPMVILAFLKEERERLERGEDPSERTGIFTTGIVAVCGGRRIVLYATGRRHAGENLLEVLRRRAPGLEPPLQMCDGLERNLPGELQTVVSNCLVHCRRQFVDVVAGFPEEVRHVLDELAIVYRNDARARTESMSPAARLLLHQQESGPVMQRLEAWFGGLLAQRKVEPNSGLGKAIHYAQKRWERLTLFLRREGAVLDNNEAERILKRAILHRKNSLFYKTQNGARVGDIYMSLIATARLNGADPFDYLTELQRNANAVAAAPGEWMPWNYRETLARIRAGAPAP
jgi:transposase